jgi:lysophospholipase L1-like esterase
VATYVSTFDGPLPLQSGDTLLKGETVDLSSLVGADAGHVETGRLVLVTGPAPEDPFDYKSLRVRTPDGVLVRADDPDTEVFDPGSVVTKAELPAAIAEDSTIGAAIAAGVDTEVAGRDLLEANDARAPRIGEGHGYVEALLTPQHKLLRGIREADGRAEFPLGVEAPHVGQVASRTVAPLYSQVRADATGKVDESAIGQDGCSPDWVLRNQRARLRAATTQTQPLAVTLPGGNAASPFLDTATAVHARYAIQRLAHKTYRVRVHVANYNDRTASAYSPVTISGVYLGRAARGSDGELNGNFASTPTTITTSASTPADGSDWVSSWFDLDLGISTDWLLSLAYTCSAQNNHGGPAPCWRSTATSEVASLTPATALTQGKYGPLKIWLEVVIDGDVPVVAAVGDSLTVGSESTRPVYDSALAKLAYANGAHPVHYAHHGSTIQEWMGGTGVKWTQWSSYRKPDATIITLGANSVFNGDSLGTMQANFATLAATVRSFLGPNIYLATILPRNSGSDSAKETVRTNYNAWLWGLPGGAVLTFDLAASVADPANAAQLASAWVAADGVHLLTSGYARNANAIVAPLASRVAL